jgi:hypothetical protein
MDVFDIVRNACMYSCSASNFLRSSVTIEKSSGFFKCAVLGLNNDCRERLDRSCTTKEKQKQELTEPEKYSFTYEPTAVNKLYTRGKLYRINWRARETHIVFPLNCIYIQLYVNN